MRLPEEVVRCARWHEEHRLFYEKITCECSCGRKYLLIPVNDDGVNCVCGKVVDSRLFSLSPRIRQFNICECDPRIGNWQPMPSGATCPTCNRARRKEPKAKKATKVHSVAVETGKK